LGLIGNIEKLLSLHPTLSDLVQRLEELENEKTGLEEKCSEYEKRLNSQVKKDHSEVFDELSDLRAENAKYMEKIIKQSKEIEQLKTADIAKTTQESRKKTAHVPRRNLEVRSPE
jgi:predicted nuclease with TOPRIM domain